MLLVTLNFTVESAPQIGTSAEFRVAGVAAFGITTKGVLQQAPVIGLRASTLPVQFVQVNFGAE